MIEKQCQGRFPEDKENKLGATTYVARDRFAGLPLTHVVIIPLNNRVVCEHLNNGKCGKVGMAVGTFDEADFPQCPFLT